MTEQTDLISIIVRDGVELMGREWQITSPDAAILIIHGLGEHSGRYDHVAKYFNQNNFVVYSFDLRGHGLSEGRRGHIPSYNRILEDVEEMLMYARSDHNDIPLFLFGHSMGGNIVANYIIQKNVNELTGAIISAPWLQTVEVIPASKIKLARIVNRIWPSLSQPNGLNVDHLTHNPDVNEAYLKDELVHDKISVRTFLSFYDAGLYALTRASKVKTSAFVYHGAKDMITSASASEKFAEAGSEKIVFKLYKDTMHEGHNDQHKSEIIDSSISWCKEQMR